MHTHLSKDQLQWLVKNEATIRFKSSDTNTKISIKCHGEKLYVHSKSDVNSVRKAMDQLITTLEFFIK